MKDPQQLYAEQGLINPTFTSLRLLDETRRANEASLEYGKVHALERLSTVSADVLKSTHLDAELPILQDRVTSPALSQSLEGYSQHVTASGTHLSEALQTFQDFGSGKSMNLVSSDYKLSALNYGISATSSVIDSALLHFTSKQLVLNSQYRHQLVDLDQQTSKHHWLRTTEGQHVLAETQTEYVNKTAEQWYANLTTRAGERTIQCDHYYVQVGEKFEPPSCGKAGIIKAIAKIPALKQFADLAGGLEIAGDMADLLGGVEGLTGFLDSIGGLESVSGLLEGVGGLSGVLDIAQSLPVDLGQVGDFIDGFQSFSEALDYFQSDRTLQSLSGTVGKAGSLGKAKDSLKNLGKLENLATGKVKGDDKLLHPTNVQLTGGRGTYEVLAEAGISLQSSKQVGIKAGCVLVETAAEQTYQGQSISVAALIDAEIKANANTRLSGGTVTIDSGICWINSLLPTPVVIKPPQLRKPLPRKPMEKELPPMKHNPTTPTAPAAGVQLGSTKVLLPPTGTAGPQTRPGSGKMPSNEPDYQPSPRKTNLDKRDFDL